MGLPRPEQTSCNGVIALREKEPAIDGTSVYFHLCIGVYLHGLLSLITLQICQSNQSYHNNLRGYEEFSGRFPLFWLGHVRLYLQYEVIIIIISHSL